MKSSRLPIPLSADSAGLAPADRGCLKAGCSSLSLLHLSGHGKHVEPARWLLRVDLPLPARIPGACGIHAGNRHVGGYSMVGGPAGRGPCRCSICPPHIHSRFQIERYILRYRHARRARSVEDDLLFVETCGRPNAGRGRGLHDQRNRGRLHTPDVLACFCHRHRVNLPDEASLEIKTGAGPCGNPR